MIASSIVLSALAFGQALALPALQPRQASEASSAIASITSAASSVASSASSAVSESASSVSSAASSSVSEASSSAASATSSGSSAAASASPSSYAAGLLAALRDRQATALADLIAGSPAIQQALVPTLENQSQNYTILAPDNSGLQSATANIDTSNTTLVTQLLSYHVLPGSYAADSLQINETQIINTAANENVVLYKDQYSTTQVVGGQNASVIANSTYQNVIIRLLNNALRLPANVSETLSRSEVGTALVSTLASTLPDLVQTIDQGSITVFAPSNQAISNVQSQLASLASNTQQLQQVILGHVVTGQVLYSNAGPNNLLSNPSGIQSGAQQPLTFSSNATGLFVETQGTTAQIIRNDIIANNNGQPAVVHIIDRVLVPAMAASSSASAAGGAASSAASGAASSASGAALSATSGAASVAASATSAVAGAASSAAAVLSSASAGVMSM